jgi:hypothetical protein
MCTKHPKQLLNVKTSTAFVPMSLQPACSRHSVTPNWLSLSSSSHSYFCGAAGQCVGGPILRHQWLRGCLHSHRAGQVCCLTPCGPCLGLLSG